MTTGINPFLSIYWRNYANFHLLYIWNVILAANWQSPDQVHSVCPAFNKVFYGSPQTICSSAVSVLPAYLPISTISADPHLHPHHQLCVIHTPLSRYHVVLTLILDKAKWFSCTGNLLWNWWVLVNFGFRLQHLFVVWTQLLLRRPVQPCRLKPV